MILETYKQGKATSRLERAGICSGIQSTWANTWYLPEVPGGESYRNLQSYAIQLGRRATDMWYWYLQGTHRIVRPGEMGNTNKPSAVALMTLKWKLSFTCALKECKVFTILRKYLMGISDAPQSYNEIQFVCTRCFHFV